MSWRMVAVAGVFVAAGCSGSASTAAISTTTAAPVSASTVSVTTGSESTVSTTSAASPTTTFVSAQCDSLEAARPRFGIDVLVSVALYCGLGLMPLSDLRLVERVVPDDGTPLEAALSQLLLGTTPEEAAVGLGSAFSAHTAGQFHSVEVDGGVAIIDFTDGFVRTNNFGTSNGGGVVGRQIAVTVYQFPGITGIDFRVNGERWCGWESSCDDGASNPLSTRADYVGPSHTDTKGVDQSFQGRLKVRFTDAARTSVEVCVIHPDPSIGVPVATCGSDKYEASEAVLNLDYQIVLDYRIEQVYIKYFRDDAAIALARVDGSELPLRRGDEGDAVSLVQQGLEAFCFHLADEVATMRPNEKFPSSTPGVFDDVTEFMVRRFQGHAGVPANGVYGPATHTLLLSEAVENTPSNEGCFA